MKIDILTLFPEMFDGFLNTSIIKRAIDKKLVDVELHNFRNFTNDKHHHVDDYPYGGGQGMVLMCQPIIDCLKSIVVGRAPATVPFNKHILSYPVIEIV